jgi:hypothetical protein
MVVIDGRRASLASAEAWKTLAKFRKQSRFYRHVAKAKQDENHNYTDQSQRKTRYYQFLAFVSSWVPCVHQGEQHNRSRRDGSQEVFNTLNIGLSEQLDQEHQHQHHCQRRSPVDYVRRGSIQDWQTDQSSSEELEQLEQVPATLEHLVPDSKPNIVLRQGSSLTAND